jgi:anti-sigma factor RsiW
MESKHFNCEACREQLVDWLGRQLPPAERAAVEAHLAQCPACQQELAALRQLWQTMSQLPAPEPSEQLRPRFYAMLAEFRAEEERETLLARLRRWLQPLLAPSPALRLAYTLLVLVAGLAIGYGLSYRSQPESSAPLAGSGAQPDQEQRMVLAQLGNPSATQRLRAVSSTKDIDQVNQAVVNALLSTLDNDPNVNVRLATLDALVLLGEDPVVRQGPGTLPHPAGVAAGAGGPGRRDGAAAGAPLPQAPAPAAAPGQPQRSRESQNRNQHSNLIPRAACRPLNSSTP